MPKQKQKKKVKEVQVFDYRLWPTILQFNTDLDGQLTSKANFLFGASTLILIYILDKVVAKSFEIIDPMVKYGWIVLLFGSFFAAVFAIMVVLPKLRIFSKKERISKDVLYYKNIIKFYSRKEYVKYLRSMAMNNDAICEAYANQVYSLAKNILPFKFKMLKYSGWTLLFSFLASSLIFIINYLIK